MEAANRGCKEARLSVGFNIVLRTSST